ncbi:hypothetical protein K6959_10155 [Bacillus aquiflavi]|nr:hypothetical protein [Bacillus aquiflavi]UAC47115.1 hypothetical protein K6959_10155 [Bacillus aquiflavi]
MKGHDAVITELPIKKENNNGYFLFQPINNKKPFLVPYPKSYDNIQNAFEDMEQPIPEYELMQSISENIKIERIVEKDQLLIIYLTKDSQLENDENTVYSIEAILLTAKDFGYDTVKFENAPIEKIGPFNLSEPIKVPLSPNKRFLAENHKK